MRRKDRAETTSYAQMGMAAMLPGMVHMLELMQAEVDRFRQQLAGLQGAVQNGTGKLASGWPADPAERSAEMRRRMAVGKAKRNLSSEALSAERKKQWDAQPAKVRKARLAKMLAGRMAKKVPAVKLEAA